jgi:hypothetical protein
MKGVMDCLADKGKGSSGYGLDYEPKKGIKHCNRGELWYVLELLKAGADCNQEWHC